LPLPTGQRRALALLGCGALCFLYFFGLARTGLLGPDEPRYAAIGHAMAASGDWVTPRLWGSPWFEKPPLLYWMTALGFEAGLDADLDIDRNTSSTPWLLDLIYTAAERGGYQSHFYANQGAIEDDHLPFAKRGVPNADVIDLDYGYNNVFHHTPQDTMDKLSPQSLQIVGDTIMETIHLLDQR